MSKQTELTSMMPLAHSDSNGAGGHLLEDHLRCVASRAQAMFSADSPAGAIAYLAGLWHDLGKYRDGFQRYIRMVGGGDAHIEGKWPSGSDKTHSAAGALWARRHLRELHGARGTVIARVLEYLIAGHHAGLANWEGGLKGRLNGADAESEFRDTLLGQPPEALLRPNVSLPEISNLPIEPNELIPGRFALWVRMLFSSLVDADFLDTEAFMNPAATGQRLPSARGMPELLNAFDAYMSAMASAVEAAGQTQNPVNLHRAAVLAACRQKAQGSPGTYTLTVPTGGGKTLASLAFALTHAVKHDKRRVVVAIPYTSIIEQTADVYRHVFAAMGDADIVLEHHSNAESSEANESALSRLASENWDAPIVVTTNVQLFESLFASRTSRCRKLHNLANAVLVIDEVQLLPVPFLQPVVDVLRLLVKDHGVTVVLSTATQPTLTEQRHFGGQGLSGYLAGEVTAIIEDEASLHLALKRVKVYLPSKIAAPQSWASIASDIARHPVVLSIVGRRADARDLYRLMKAEVGSLGLWHLSALMCPQHRSEVIADIKAQLLKRRAATAEAREVEPIRVVSTQLVEAGVDLDFPVVFRAKAGLDSVAQAAGRCNREGRLDVGHLHVFDPPKPPPAGLLRTAASACSAVWDDLQEGDDPLSPDRMDRYFTRLYADAHSLDAKGIRAALKLEIDKCEQALRLRFRDAADAFNLIEDQNSATIFVRWRSAQCRDDIDKLIARLERDGPERWLMRKLQRYAVNIYHHDLRRLLASGDVREIRPGLYVQTESDVFYDPELGVCLDGAPGDPSNYIL